MKDDYIKAIKVLIEKGSAAEKADDALKFTQAVLNLMHALSIYTNEVSDNWFD